MVAEPSRVGKVQERGKVLRGRPLKRQVQTENRQLERHTLGSVLVGPPETWEKVSGMVLLSDFYEPRLAEIYEAMLVLGKRGELFGKSGTPDTTLIVKEIQRQNKNAQHAQILISELVNDMPTWANGPRYAREMVENAIERAANVVTRDFSEGYVTWEELHAALAQLDRRRESLSSQSPAPEPLGVSLADVEVEDFRWLWHGRIALGKLAEFLGDGGVGKSLATLDLAARVAMGYDMPDGTPGLDAPAGVVLICGEDGLADTVVPRLLAAGASPEALRRVRAINGAPETLADGTVIERMLSLLADLPALEATITAIGARLLIIDPITAYLGDTVHANYENEVRRVLTPVARMAERLDVAVVSIRHINRAHGAPAQHRGIGSVAFTNVARLGMLFAPNPDPDAEGEILVSRFKGNIGAPPPTLAYRIEQVGEAENMPRISWLGERETTAGDALAAQSGASADRETRSATDEAVEWLRQYLAAGPRPADEAVQEAKAAGIITDEKHDKSLRKARERLGITLKNGTVYREGGVASGGRWMWRYDAPSPDGGHLSENDPSAQASSPQYNGTGAKMPTPDEEGHLSGQNATKMPSENGLWHLSTNAEFNGAGDAPGGGVSPKVPKMPSLQVTGNLRNGSVPPGRACYVCKAWLPALPEGGYAPCEQCATVREEVRS